MFTILKSIYDHRSFCHWPGRRIWVPGQEIRPRSGSCPQNLVDLSLQLRGQLLQQLQGSERVFQLSSCPGSNESRVEILVLQTPSNGEVGQFEAKLLCDSRDFLEFVDGLVSGVLVVEKLLGELKGEPERGIVGPDNLILRNSIKILSCEETPSKRTPSNQTILVNLEQLLVFNFEISSHKHIVLILAPNGLMKVQLLADAQSLEDHFCLPVAGGPVIDESFLDDLVVGSAYFLERSVIVVKVGIEDVDGVNLEPFQALLNALLDVLSVCIPFRIHICIIGSMDFSGDHDLFSGDFEVLEDFSELDLRCSRGIDFGSVEEIDAIFESELDYFFVLLVAFGFAVDHIAEGDG